MHRNYNSTCRQSTMGIKRKRRRLLIAFLRQGEKIVRFMEEFAAVLQVFHLCLCLVFPNQVTKLLSCQRTQSKIVMKKQPLNITSLQGLAKLNKFTSLEAEYALSHDLIGILSVWPSMWNSIKSLPSDFHNRLPSRNN